MNENKRALAWAALGLLLAALLVPFIIAALGRADLAMGFAITAGLLALILGAFSRSDRLGRRVTLALPLLAVIGGIAGVALVALRTSHRVAFEAAQSQRERMRSQAEQQARQKAEIETRQKTENPQKL